MASTDCVWRSCPALSIHCLVAPDSPFCCRHALDNCCPFQHAFNIGDHLLLLKRLLLETQISFNIYVLNHIDSNAYSIVLSYVAGWIGNDAVTPIIGEHDPYFHVYGRVSSTTFSLLSS